MGGSTLALFAARSHIGTEAMLCGIIVGAQAMVLCVGTMIEAPPRLHFFSID